MFFRKVSFLLRFFLLVQAFSIGQLFAAQGVEQNVAKDRCKNLSKYDRAILQEYGVSSVRSWKEIDVSVITKDDLVVVDIDQTLVQEGDCLPWNYYHGNTCDAHFAIDQAVKYYQKLWHADIHAAAFCEENRDLIEPCIKDVFSQLKSQGVSVIACSSCSSSPEFVKARSERLANLGLNLGLGFDCSAADVKKAFKPWGNRPAYSGGIIFTDHIDDKGPIIIALLKEVYPQALLPKRIFFVDDLPHNHVSVPKACKANGIECRPYLYCHNRKIAWDPKLVNFQLAHLAKTGVWLLDSLAQKALLEISA